MRVPFPLELSIGTDLIACSRILDPLKPNPRQQQHLRRLTARFLHERELRDLDKRFPDWHQVETLAVDHRRRISFWLAGRWAAKEAAKKAWNASLLGWKDLWVEVVADGNVQIICSPAFNNSTTSSTVKRGTATVAVMEQVAKLSISHDADFALATVLATPLHSDILAELRERKSTAEQTVNAGV